MYPSEKYDQERHISDKEFRSIVCNITNIKPDDPIFDQINEIDIRIVKASTRAVDIKNHIHKVKNGLG